MSFSELMASFAAKTGIETEGSRGGAAFKYEDLIILLQEAGDLLLLRTDLGFIRQDAEKPLLRERYGDAAPVLFAMGAELCVVGAVSFFPAKDKKSAVKGLFWDAFVFVNCWLWGNGVLQLLKTAVGRIRPYMYFSNPKGHGVKGGDFCRSWPSGHCLRAFVVFGFLFFWFFFRKKDSKIRTPALCAAFLLSVLVMFLRVHSGNHFVTDSLCGAAIGFLTSGAVFLACEKVRSAPKTPLDQKA